MHKSSYYSIRTPRTGFKNRLLFLVEIQDILMFPMKSNKKEKPFKTAFHNENEN